MAPDEVLDFFAATVEQVVGPYLRAQGFSPESSSEDRVVYRQGDAVVSFGFYREDLPSPWVAVDVGRRQPDGSERLVPLWRAIPDSAPERGYTGWQFRNRSELERVLERIVEHVLPASAAPLWEDDSRFARLLAEQDADVQREYQRSVDRATLLAARRAFEAGSYQSAVDKYALLDPESLAATDRRRLHQARARLSPGSDSPDSK